MTSYETKNAHKLTRMILPVFRRVDYPLLQRTGQTLLALDQQPVAELGQVAHHGLHFLLLEALRVLLKHGVHLQAHVLYPLVVVQVVVVQQSHLVLQIRHGLLQLLKVALWLNFPALFVASARR